MDEARPALNRAEVREVDRIATERYGIPGIVLMENAGLRAALRIQALLPAGGAVAILCGGGNNGGDGYVIARQLALAGVAVSVFATHALERLTGDAATNREIADRMGLDVQPIETPEAAAACAVRLAGAALVVDALLGTGFRGTVRSTAAAAIAALEAARSSGAIVVAIDLPSGLDCDSGAPSNATVRADFTLTFVGRKVGFDAPGAAEWTGQVEVLSIGAPVGRTEPE